ncbi:Cysteine-rich repeat secretory protein 55 [Apostasia shenzhenica]|uniref:Cysteine-rich repeat secretory protein 55 n=1 Tax=Apostasia shenzhenica TaxID=1088818 RepID=A0A2I0AQ48_9ASPA|nr:Cysteine-rich repeat secretory protein 55 [Apostasia shenzhenica]
MEYTNNYLALILTTALLLAPFALGDYDCAIKSPAEERDPLLRHRVRNALVELIEALIINNKDNYYNSIIYNFKGSPDSPPNNIYIKGWCPYDVSKEVCAHWIAVIATQMSKACPTSTSAHMFHGSICYIRYDTKNFLGQPDTDAAHVGYGTARVMLFYFDYFTKKVDELMKMLTEMAPTQRNMVGTGTTKALLAKEISDVLRRKVNITGLAQCSTDLNKNTCLECLNQAKKELSNGCRGQLACHVFLGSCILKYEAVFF